VFLIHDSNVFSKGFVVSQYVNGDLAFADDLIPFIERLVDHMGYDRTFFIDDAIVVLKDD
jgi:hypothetical protein